MIASGSDSCSKLHSFRDKVEPELPAAIRAGKIYGSRVELSVVKRRMRGCALGFFGGHVIATEAAKHLDFRMLLNARQLAQEHHG
jgi:hypothetical protein